MARAIWKGNINFGLVNIPVGLYTAEASNEMSFRMLDRRNLKPIKYERVNAETRKEVPWSEIVKGYEYEPDEYVLMGDADFKAAQPAATQSITIMEFVDAASIHPVYYNTPYYLVPEKKAAHAYALLREAMRKSGKVGIAKLVIHTREHLAAVMIRENALVAELMRFADELNSLDEYEFPPMEASKAGIGEKEISMALRLIGEMVGEWKPEKYKDEYRDALMGFIEKKVKSGQTHEITAEGEVEKPAGPARVVNVMDLLKRSLQERGAVEEEEEAQEATGTEDVAPKTRKHTAGRKHMAAKTEKRGGAAKKSPRSKR